MKTFTQLNENKASVTSDINQGNCGCLGVTNHYTPVENIVTSVRNLFCPILGCVVCVGEDGVSVKMHSTKFVDKTSISKLLNQPCYNGISVNTYIIQQGLDLVKMLCVGQYWIVYYCPRDIPQVSTPAANSAVSACCGCCEQLEEEAELFNFINESDDDEEIETKNKKEIRKILNGKDKVKAAKALEAIVAKEMELPREYYFAGVKDKAGNESVALRWKYTRRSGKKQTTEITKTLINIYDTEEDGVFVADFDEKSMFKLPDEVEKLIKNILDMIGAEETKDKAVYSLAESEDKKDDKKQDKKEDKKDEKENDDDLLGSKKDDDDSEDDDSRGDKSDDLL